MVIRWVVKHTEEINTFSQFMRLEEKGNLGTPINLKLSGFLMSCQYHSSVGKTARGGSTVAPVYSDSGKLANSWLLLFEFMECP